MSAMAPPTPISIQLVDRRLTVIAFSREQLEGLKTPCYIFDKGELEDNFLDFTRAVQDAWGPCSHIAYSVKTNPLTWIVKEAQRCGCFAETVSDEEYHLALCCGFSPKQIVFNGPAKSRAWFEYAVRSGSIVNIDLPREIDWVEELAAKGVECHVGIRSNVDLESSFPGQTIGGKEGGRFGFSLESGGLGEQIRRLKGIRGVRLCGLHMHFTTYCRTPEVYQCLANYACQIAREYDLLDDISYIDIGGGYYGGGVQNAGRYEQYAQAISKQLSQAFDKDKVSLYLEPGGAVVCTPGYYVGRVLDVKDMLTDRHVVTELSRLHIDHELKKTSYNHVLYTRRTNTYPRQVIDAFTCLESDRLTVLEDEPELSRDDIVLINFAGAYSLGFVPGFFIKLPPAVYSYDRDANTFELVRDAFSELPPTV